LLCHDETRNFPLRCRELQQGKIPLAVQGTELFEPSEIENDENKPLQNTLPPHRGAFQGTIALHDDPAEVQDVSHVVQKLKAEVKTARAAELEARCQAAAMHAEVEEIRLVIDQLQNETSRKKVWRAHLTRTCTYVLNASCIFCCTSGFHIMRCLAWDLFQPLVAGFSDMHRTLQKSSLMLLKAQVVTMLCSRHGQVLQGLPLPVQLCLVYDSALRLQDQQATCSPTSL
jgi:hypothetical protein